MTQTSLTTAADLNTAGTATASAGDAAAGNIIATPSFTDPTNGDFTLDGDTSSAIGEGGLDLSGMAGFPTADLGGTSRTTPWSIGAYEFDGPFAAGYAIGDTGPAGGIIFYDDEADGVDDIAGARYLEVAPSETEWSDKEWGGYGART